MQKLRKEKTSEPLHAAQTCARLIPTARDLMLTENISLFTDVVLQDWCAVIIINIVSTSEVIIKQFYIVFYTSKVL